MKFAKQLWSIIVILALFLAFATSCNSSKDILSASGKHTTHPTGISKHGKVKRSASKPPPKSAVPLQKKYVIKNNKSKTVFW